VTAEHSYWSSINFSACVLISEAKILRSIHDMKEVTVVDTPSLSQKLIFALYLVAKLLSEEMQTAFL